MDEIKHKVLGFLNKQQMSNTKIPSMGFHDEVYFHENTTNTTVKKRASQIDEILSINSKTVNDELRPDDQLILDSIQQIYFNQDSSFDASKFILQKLPSTTLDCTKLEDEFKNLKVQQQCVSKKVLNMILQQQTSCQEQFRDVIALQSKLQEAVVTCRQSRTHLNAAKDQFASSLGVLANYRKRQILKGLMHYLITIKTLYETEEHLQELLREGNYLTAILLLKERLTVASLYRHFSCIAELTKKFHDTLEVSENQLDSALENICYNFDEDVYAKLQSAYKKLENGRVAIDQLNMHFTTAVHNSAFKVIHKYALLNEKTLQDLTNEKKQYKQLCQYVSTGDFLACLIDLCKSFWVIITSYYRISQYHLNPKPDHQSLSMSPTFNFQDTQTSSRQSSTENSINSPRSPTTPDFEDTLNQNYIKQKLENGVVKLWNDIQSKVATFLINANLEVFQFENFVQILSILHRLIKIGEEFCDSKSEELQEAIRRKSVSYLQNYHSSRLEELRIFFENEMWEICPVKANFEISQLQEFKSLRHTLKHFKDKKTSTSTVVSTSTSTSTSKNDLASNHSQEGSTTSDKYFIRFDVNYTPFDIKFDDTLTDENILSDTIHDDDPNALHNTETDTDSENEEVTREFIDETQMINETSTNQNNHSIRKHRHGHEKSSGRHILLTNTTLSVLRQIGKYLQMSKLLQPISLDIFYCLTQLFEYYLYSVNSCFTSDLSVGGGSLYSIKLNAVLKRISEQLIKSNTESYSDSNLNDLDTSNLSTSSVSHLKETKNNPKDLQSLNVQCPYLNTCVKINSPENLYGLTVRIVAVESLIFLAKQFEHLENYLEYLVPPEHSHTISHFYNQTISVAKDLRKPIYMAVASQSFDLRQTLLSMSKVNWEVKDVMSEHNKYIDVLLREVQIFAMRLEDIEEKLQMPSDVYYCVWESVAHVITHTLVEGFSNAKKCSNGGRGLMQLDFTQFMSTFEKTTKIRSMPHRDYVEWYIKAYYLPENSIEQFIREHTEYSAKHMYGLIACINHISKKTRQKLCGIIEDIERSR
ncbi:syndetin [Chrysoperla carnea]|uniref:syndetin n=1 Tax=Chrysoperla carnea TaxID=189513 RepID=UPI001D094A9B|nr:syndetin [Chrysoperla carnea]